MLYSKSTAKNISLPLFLHPAPIYSIQTVQNPLSSTISTSSADILYSNSTAKSLSLPLFLYPAPIYSHQIVQQKLSLPLYLHPAPIYSHQIVEKKLSLSSTISTSSADILSSNSIEKTLSLFHYFYIQRRYTLIK